MCICIPNPAERSGRRLTKRFCHDKNMCSLCANNQFHFSQYNVCNLLFNGKSRTVVVSCTPHTPPYFQLHSRKVDCQPSALSARDRFTNYLGAVMENRFALLLSLLLLLLVQLMNSNSIIIIYSTFCLPLRFALPILSHEISHARESNRRA